MAHTGMRALILALTSSFIYTNAAVLKCDDIQMIIKRHGDQRNWYYDNPPQYKNRNCRNCYLKRDGDDCMENDDGSESCPRLIEIDQTPADSEKWICPRHCYTMPEIPYQLKVTKTKSTYKCDSILACGTEIKDATPTIFNVNMPTAFKIEDGSSYSYQDSADPNTYAVRPISLCKTKRYEDNFNVRVVSCWQWSFNKPRMSHLDTLWKSGDTKIHTIYTGSTGINQNKQAIPMCNTIDDRLTMKFQTEPCWMEQITPAQQNKQFSIRPYYTYYRSRESISDVTDCRMQVLGADFAKAAGAVMRWDQSPFPLFLQSSDQFGDYNVNKHWRTPLTRRDHYYNVKPVFDGMTQRFGTFYEKEDKSITKWDYRLACTDKYNRPQLSPKTIYAESGCNDIPCVDFISKPCYDNIYRFDEMLCPLIQFRFSGENAQGIKFSSFRHKIIMLEPERVNFMQYGLHDGNSYFQIVYDNTRVRVRKNTNEIVQPNNPTIFADNDIISVSLIQDGAVRFSCTGCLHLDLFGRQSAVKPMLHDITACRGCILYEKVQEYSEYQDCVPCDPHHIRNPDKATECRKCGEINRTKPMRRAAPYPQTDQECTTCKQFQYFDVSTPEGCKFLPTVTDNVKVINRKVELSGQDYYIKNELRKEIEEQFWRDNRPENASWYADIKLSECTYSSEDESILVKRLNFRSWCGHQEMVRHQQAWVQVDGSSLYVPLNNDMGRTRSNTTVVDLCNSTLKQVQGSTTADLQCGQRQFRIIRSGFQDPCTRCNGTKYTKNCWPTYAPGLEIYDDQYFLPANKKTLVPQPGECAACNAKCDTANEYIDPVQYSCWWNGTGRIAGVLGATATNFSWYKPAPCTKCANVKLAATKAELYLSCGNRVSYRRWLPDDVSDSTKTPLRSIPSIQVCCTEPLTVKQCTDNELEFETFSPQNCRQSVDDTPPATLAYCPPGWYVDETCARENTLWSPDCCVKCKACRGGKFKTDAYYDCPGNEYFDSQDRGCTTSCLTNQYLRNERCIKCEACE